MRAFARRFFRRWTSPLGLAVLVLVLAMAVSAPYVFREDPFTMVTRPLLWPGENMAYVLGSDMLGRDLLAGIFHGARVSLAIGAAATAAALSVGVLVGALAGYHGGAIDDLLMRGTEAFQTIPPFVFVIVVVVIARPSIRSTILAIALVSWPAVARLVRAEFLTLRQREFVQACRAVGMGDARIIVRQIAPNALPPIIVTASIMVATAILTESALAFLGLGDPNVMSWGSMIGAGREMLRTEWYLTAIPGLAILVTVLALNLIGDGLNDALNPRLRDR
jgi:peptide/nickel transport system permease protein